MRTTETINAEIAVLKSKIKPLAEQLDKLNRELRDTASKDFISANRITRDDVEMSDGEGKPYFGNVWAFTEWMRRQRTAKAWAEWNGLIYHTHHLLSGVMPDDMPGRVDDLPK